MRLLNASRVMGDHPPPALMQIRIPEPLRYLLYMERNGLPLTVEEPADIAHVRALLAAGFVDATIPLPSMERGSFGEQPPATVHRLTRHGRLEVERLRKP